MKWIYFIFLNFLQVLHSALIHKEMRGRSSFCSKYITLDDKLFTHILKHYPDIPNEVGAIIPSNTNIHTEIKKKQNGY